MTTSRGLSWAIVILHIGALLVIPAEWTFLQGMAAGSLVVQVLDWWRHRTCTEGWQACGLLRSLDDGERIMDEFTDDHPEADTPAHHLAFASHHQRLSLGLPLVTPVGAVTVASLSFAEGIPATSAALLVLAMAWAGLQVACTRIALTIFAEPEWGDDRD